MRAMTPFRRRDPHARFLELLSTQLDQPLRLDETWQLTVHLSRCQRCRSVERDYREQRRRLRALPDLPPPRDLGARVSAALDREMLRTPGLSGGGRILAPAGPRVGRATIAGTSAVVSVAALAVGALVVLSGLPPALPDSSPLRPTPMAVQRQALAYLGAGPDGLALYRTSVDQVCPVSAIDCLQAADDQAYLPFARDVRPDSLALSPTGDRLVLRAEDVNTREDVFAVVTMSDLSSGPLAPDQSPSWRSRTPLATTAVAATPRATRQPTQTPAPAGSPAGSPGESPAEGPVESPAASPAESPATASTPSVAPSNAPETPSAVVSIAPSTGVPTPLSTAAAMTMVAILEDVRGAGAAPAWSADGTMLAFSAMPSDGSHGPDIYVWQPGDASARPVTRDHASYFASWSGGHIVASRAVRQDDAQGSIAISNVVIDPLTGEETPVRGLSMWLPQVSHDRSRAVGWRGQLEVDSERAVVSPARGELFVFDWSVVDPFGDGAPTAPPSDTPAPPASPSPEPSRSPAEPPRPSGAAETPRLVTLPPDGLSGGRPTVVRGSGSGEQPRAGEQPPAGEQPRASDGPAASASPNASQKPPTPSSSPTLAPTEPPSVDLGLAPLVPVQGGPDPSVVDWEARWAPDGSALGYWVADAPGATWGRLTVLAVDASGQVSFDEPLLAPTLARRSFAMGLSRVAWVAPTEATPEGELRISAWGPDGSGVLRLGDPELRGLLAAF